MNEKSILVIFPGPIFPIKMASQVRVYYMIRKLSQDHIVDVAGFIKTDDELEESKKNLTNICRHFYPIFKLNSGNNFLKKVILRLKFIFLSSFFHLPMELFYNTQKIYLNQLMNIIRKNDYDIVQVEYWFMGKLFRLLDDHVFKVIDTHDILHEKREQEFKQGRTSKKLKNLYKKITVYKNLELSNLKIADALIAISKYEYNKLKNLAECKNTILIPTGQHIEYFKNYPVFPENNTILFYGSMSSASNISAFFRFWNNIYPKIKNTNKNVRVLVVGANPPKSIIKLANNDAIIVTGYVKDVRRYLAKASILILPLDVAAGFRSRVVEAMAIGIPVIGTPKALDSIEMISGIHGYISDSNEEIANIAIKILNNSELRDNMSKECKKFVAEKYSIEATYGKLSKFYSGLILNKNI